MSDRQHRKGPSIRIVQSGDHIESEHPDGVPEGATWGDVRAAVDDMGIPVRPLKVLEDPPEGMVEFHGPIV